MLAKRIIPCLDVKDGRVVKGINFVGLQDVGDAVELGRRYAEEGADELVYLDISATIEGRNTFAELVSKVADTVNIPFTVGGGIRCMEDAARLLDAGADKITINSAAIAHPELIGEIAARYGATVVLKGCRTLVVSADGTRAYENATGNPFMALGGMGDLLSGALGARWAYIKDDAFIAAASSVWLHGAAGDKVVADGLDPSLANVAAAMGSLRVMFDK